MAALILWAALFLCSGVKTSPQQAFIENQALSPYSEWVGLPRIDPESTGRDRHEFLRAVPDVFWTASPVYWGGSGYSDYAVLNSVETPQTESEFLRELPNIAISLKIINERALRASHSDPSLAKTYAAFKQSLQDFAGPIDKIRKASPEEQPELTNAFLGSVMDQLTDLDMKARRNFLRVDDNVKTARQEFVRLRGIFDRLRKTQGILSTTARSSQIDFHSLDEFAQTQFIRRQPLRVQLRLLLYEANPTIRRMITRMEYTNMKQGYDRLIGHPLILNRPGPDEEKDLENVVLYILHCFGEYTLNKQGVADRPLHRKLAGLDIDARRWVHKVVKDRVVNEFISDEDWKIFLRRAWDPERRRLDPGVVKAVIRYHRQVYEPKFVKKYPTKKVNELLRLISHKAARDITWVALTMTEDEGKRFLPKDNVKARAQTAADILKEIKPPKETNPRPTEEEQRAEAQAAQSRRWEIAQSLQAFWHDGFVPTKRWLWKNYPSIAEDIPKYFIEYDLAYRVVGLPPAIEKILKYSVYRNAAKYTIAHAFIEELNKSEGRSIMHFIDDPYLHPLLATILDMAEGNWVKAAAQWLPAERLKTNGMPPLPHITTESIEAKVLVAFRRYEKKAIRTNVDVQRHRLATRYIGLSM